MEFIKRIFDIVTALFLLALVWPVLVTCAVLVKLSSPGPVFYRGVRTGRFGKPFRIFKFRSMRTDAEQTGGTTTGENDPRITGIGHVLRKYKIDELPQLFNVLLGDMSFVGPRPEVAEYTDAYTDEERQILAVRPGITDLACLEFSDLQEHVGEEDPDEAYRQRILPRKNALRLKYAREQSLALDVEILGKTAALVLSKPFRKRKPNGVRKAA
ncbi:MAG: sugar transferase [Planctomycetaceae bacterium]|nr:sugar transferase [Planctomycetaceae bacterium]MCB9949872.1 sugar transferase [Planctomycetaceae bacterium]